MVAILGLFLCLLHLHVRRGIRALLGLARLQVGVTAHHELHRSRDERPAGWDCALRAVIRIRVGGWVGGWAWVLVSV